MYSIFSTILMLSPVLLGILITILILNHSKKDSKRVQQENEKAVLDRIIETMDENPREVYKQEPHKRTEADGKYRVIRMSCRKCGATTELQSDQQILFCSHCGSKELIIESDYIKEARINAEMNKKIAEEKRQTANDLYDKYRQAHREYYKEVRKTTIHRTITSIVQLILIIIFGALLFVGFIFGILKLPDLFKITN